MHLNYRLSIHSIIKKLRLNLKCHLHLCHIFKNNFYQQCKLLFFYYIIKIPQANVYLFNIIMNIKNKICHVSRLLNIKMPDIIFNDLIGFSYSKGTLYLRRIGNEKELLFLSLHELSYTNFIVIQTF